MSAVKLGRSMRQVHRWLCIAFTLTVITNFALRGLALPPPAWVTYAPLPPLAALLLTGLCLFAQPYAGRWRQTLQAGVAGRTRWALTLIGR